MSRAASLIGMVTVLAVVAVAVFAFVQLGDGSGGGSVGPDAGPATPAEQTSDAAEPLPVPVNRIVVEASSHLPPDEGRGITYEPENTLDTDLATAWNSDSRADQGRGEQLTFRFSEPIRLQGLQFVNGYVKSPDVFAANHRIRTLMVTADGASYEATLLDTGDRQEISFDFGLTSKVVIEVVDVYPGSGFSDDALTADLALTEISFLAPRPVSG